MVEFYLLTFLRFPLRKKEHKSYFGKNRTHDFRMILADVQLTYHSGDEHHIALYTCSKSKDRSGKVANPARGQLDRENGHFSVRVSA